MIERDYRKIILERLYNIERMRDLHVRIFQSKKHWLVVFMSPLISNLTICGRGMQQGARYSSQFTHLVLSLATVVVHITIDDYYRCGHSIAAAAAVVY